MDDHDESKLPKWAQDRLLRRQREIARLALELDEARGALGPTRIVHEPYVHPRFLSEETIVYEIKPGKKISVRLLGDTLELMAGGNRIVVMPKSSNVIYVRPENYEVI